jgi:hypothetical protein
MWSTTGERVKMEIAVPEMDINPEAMLAAKQCPHSVFTLEVVN